MRPLRRAPLRCDITLLTPLFFFVCTRDILQEKWNKKNINASTAIITTTAVLLVQLLLHVRQHFFTYLFFPLTWFWLVSGNFYGIINSTGRGGGCRTFASWHFLHFFMDCFVCFGYKEVFGQWRKRMKDMREEVCHKWGPEETWTEAAAEDPRG